MAQLSSYSEEEIKQFQEYMKKYPMANTWTTADGIVIPYKFIKFQHLENILTFLDAYKEHYIARMGDHEFGIMLKGLKKLRKNKVDKMGPTGQILYGDAKKG